MSNTDQEKAEILNNFFTSVFTGEDHSTMPTVNKKPLKHNLEEMVFTPELVRKKLQELKVNKSPGPDGMHPKVLKELSKVISIPLPVIFTKLFQSGVLLTIRKIATVTPIFKKGDRHSPANYRPVSLMSIVCKTMEGLV